MTGLSQTLLSLRTQLRTPRPFKSSAHSSAIAWPGPVSFNVFDTLITRVWLRPEHVFLATGRRLKLHNLFTGTPGEWSRLRISTANTLAQHAGPSREITLATIYSEIARQLHWTDDQCRQACKIELSVERQSIRPIASIRHLYRERVRLERNTVLLSDMYLGTESVLCLLHTCRIQTPRSLLYVSSDFNCTKRSGELFRIVQTLHQIPARRFLHIGDSRRVDVVKARLAGFRALHFSETLPTRYERALAGDSTDPILLAFAGAARAARLSWKPRSDRERVIWNASTNVAGPVLFCFVAWTIYSACRNNVDHVYFLARDGEIMMRLARLMCREWAPSLTCSYLYGSRQSWHLPATFDVEAFECGWILDSADAVSLRQILQRVDLEPERLQSVLNRHGLEMKCWDSVLSKQGRRQCERLLLDREFKAAVRARAEVAREGVLEYFRREKVFDSKRIALVDLGWRGRMQRSFSRIVRAAEPLFDDRLCGFYLGLVRMPFQNEEGGMYESLFDAADDKELPSGHYGYWDMLEIFCKARHGSVLGFVKREDGGVCPVLDDEIGDAGWETGLQQRGIVAFAREMICASRILQVEDFGNCENLRRASLEALKMFVETPSRDEAETYGSAFVAADQSHKAHVEFGARLGMLKSLAFLCAPELFDRIRWRQGTAARSVIWPGTGAATRFLRWRRRLIQRVGLGRLRKCFHSSR